MADRLDLATYIVFLVLLLLIVAMLIAILVATATASKPKTLTRIVQAPSSATDRNGRTTVDVLALYAYKSLDVSTFPNEAQVRGLIQQALIASPALPATSSWEQVAQFMADSIIDNFEVKAASVQILFTPNQGSVTFTKGFIPPLRDVAG